MTDATINTLLAELAAHVADEADLAYADEDLTGGQKRELFAGRLDRTSAASVASAIVPTGGPSRVGDFLEEWTFQVLTAAPTRAAALARADEIARLFFDTDGRPVTGLTLTTWRLLAVDLIQRPTPIGPNETGGEDVTFNLLVRAHRA